MSLTSDSTLVLKTTVLSGVSFSWETLLEAELVWASVAVESPMGTPKDVTRKFKTDGS